ncbi:MAG: ABC transporter ATP-binding protein [Saprospiraceae bacterium]
MKPIIEVNHVWKEYHKGIDRRYKSLRDTITGIPEWMFRSDKEKFWALEDIDFKVEAGESIGIIGKNGAGKSTLLKILSRITPPTIGEIKLRGRVASLLEVGTGFHPELTGRENIFFNGSILGMKNIEIKRKFDEIVNFSGVESFIDTPLKHFSSGMQMRLAFSVAAHLDSDILLIDEVLAVGDAEFQLKCIGKMDEVSAREGKTVIFVSHNLNVVKSLCKNSLLLHNARTSPLLNSDEAIRKYQNFERENVNFEFQGPLKDIFKVDKIRINGVEFLSGFVNLNSLNDNMFEILFRKDTFDDPFRITFSVYKDDLRIFTLHDKVISSSKSNQFSSIFIMPSYTLRSGIYKIGLGGYSKGTHGPWFWNSNIISFTILANWDNKMEEINKGVINVFSNSQRIEN